MNVSSLRGWSIGCLILSVTGCATSTPEPLAVHVEAPPPIASSPPPALDWSSIRARRVDIGGAGDAICRLGLSTAIGCFKAPDRYHGRGYITLEPVPMGGEAWASVDLGLVDADALTTDGKLWRWTFVQPGARARLVMGGVEATVQGGMASVVAVESGPVYRDDNVEKTFFDVDEVRFVAGRQDTYGVIDAGGRVWIPWTLDDVMGMSRDDVPLRIPLPGPARYLDLDRGRGCAVVQTDDGLPAARGRVHCWEMATGGLQRIDLPLASRVTVGSGHACALTVGGEIWCWGNNHRGELGQGDFEVRDAPQRVVLPEAMVDLAATHHGTCAVSERHTYCWGEVEPAYEGRRARPERLRKNPRMPLESD